MRIRTWVQVVFNQKTGLWLTGLSIRGLFFGGRLLELMSWLGSQKNTDFNYHIQIISSQSQCTRIYLLLSMVIIFFKGNNHVVDSSWEIMTYYNYYFSFVLKDFNNINEIKCPLHFLAKFVFFDDESFEKSEGKW